MLRTKIFRQVANRLKKFSIQPVLRTLDSFSDIFVEKFLSLFEMNSNENPMSNCFINQGS